MGTERPDPGALYIDREIRIFTGADAETLLAEDSDSHYVDARGGIHSVDRDRWLEAQHCEHRHWFGNEANTADDHNFENARWFAGFESIRGRHFPRAIELGCGPFTNLRIVARMCTIDSCDLLDPLIDQYLGHRNAFYSKDRLSVLAGSTPLYGRLHKRLPPFVTRLASRVGPSVPVRRTIASGIEDFEVEPGIYDLVVLINVLEHCWDADAVLRNIDLMMPSGGTLVFADVAFDRDDLGAVSNRQRDAAHPLRVLESTVSEFLARYRPSFHSRVATSAGLYRNCTMHYFIGEKL